MTNTELHHEIGQLLMCGFHGTEATEGILHLIRNCNLGAIILFSRNITSPSQLQRLTHQLQSAAKAANHLRPLLIAVDQENGVVRRLGRSGTYFPGSMALGAIDSSSAAYQVATATADELKALGINWNLAPVMDVNNNALNPVIGVRSFGQDPYKVATLALAQVEAYQRRGMVTSVKHFPGHGDTATDSHLGIPVIDRSLDELKQVELVPFMHALKAEGRSRPESVMIAHMALPQITKKPASISKEVVTDLLRQELGYEGIIITDCCEMDAIKESVGAAAGAVLSLKAGNDMTMISHTYEFQKKAFELLYGELDASSLDETAIRASLARVAKLKDHYLTWDEALKEHDLSVIGCKAHLDLSQRLYKQVPTVVRDEKKVLPIKPTQDQKLLFLAAHVPLTLAIDSESEPFNSMYESLKLHHSNTEYIIFDESTSDLTKTIQSADYVVVGTGNGNLHPFQSQLVKLAHQHAKRLIVVAVINPYDLMSFPEISTYIVTYEYTPPAHDAFVAVLFGELTTHNVLPITIPNTYLDASPAPYDIKEVSQVDTQAAHALWTITFKDWPLSYKNFALILSRMLQPHYYVAYKEQEMVGFAVTQIKENSAQLALLMVHPQHRHQGIGTQLNDLCLQMFRMKGLSVMLGSTYPRFFCGLPDESFKTFFEHRGYAFQPEPVWDLMGDLTNYQIPASLSARMIKEGISFGPIQADQAQELLDFQHKYFDNWASTYHHHVDLGDYQDLFVARDNTGRIVGSLVLNTTGQSHGYRTDLMWTDDRLFGESSGGMACVGVAKEERGRGIGIGLVAYANDLLSKRGVKLSYVDWVELTDFYSRTGYQKWRSYRLAAMK
jgi:beta-N-acetylhexosaminidase